MTARAATTRVGRVRALAWFYLRAARLAAIQKFTYRASNYLFLVGMVAEPLVYLVVWTTIANARGGSVGGYTPRGLAAYYILWTLVRSMNLVYAPAGFEWRIATGRMSGRLLLPLHPIHFDLATFAGQKVVLIAQWVPVAALLSWLFHPAFQFSAPGVLVFLVAIWGAFGVRSVFMWLVGMVTFWTTRASALFELYGVAELLLSGRLVPMSLLPDWLRRVADWLPFTWTFAYPINTVATRMSVGELLTGLAAQLVWIIVGGLLLAVVWRRAVARYSAVGA